MKRFNYTFYFVLLVLLPSTVVAADLQDVLENVRHMLGPLTTLLLFVSYIAGIGMIYKGITMLKQFGVPPTQMSRPGELSGPLIYLVVGAILLYLPSTTDVFTQTIFGAGSRSIINGNTISFSSIGSGSELIGYYSSSGNLEGQFADLADTAIIILQFIGLFSFIRGWFIISHAGQQGAQPGSVTKGMIHIIGGIVAINFVPAAAIFRNTILGG